MSVAQCRECGRDVAVHEIETMMRTTPNSSSTRYRCPYCRSGMRDIKTRIT